MFCSIGIFLISVFICISRVSTKSDGQRDNLPCAYSFHVWNPGHDIVQKVSNVNYKVENMTGYIEREFLKLKTNMLEELNKCQNWTIALERDLTDLKFKTLKGRIIERDTSNSLTDVERDILDLKKKVSHLKNNYQKVHKSIADNRDGVPIGQDQKSMLDMLKDAVRDLKAEWVVLKRDVIELQMEHSEIKMGQNVNSINASKSLKSLESLESKWSYFKQESENFTKTLKSLFDSQSKYSAKINELEGTEQKLFDTITKLEQEVKQLSDHVTILNKDFSLLKNDNAYLKEIVLASTKVAGVKKGTKKELKRDVKNGSPKDCQDIMDMGFEVSGVYQIKPEGALDLDNVYCEMLNDTAYTVIQRRTDGLLSFNRQWIEYKFGFGNLYGSHWVGNEWIHLLTKQDEYTLRIDMWDWEGRKHFAEYNIFKVGNQDEDYTLRIEGYTGNAGDSLSFHDGMKFSTEDMDNDLNIRHCAAENKSGWWFNNCYLSNLNGVYHVGYYSHTQYSDGIVWYTLKENEKYSLRKVEMKLRRNT